MTALHSDLSIVAIVPLYNGARWIEEAIKSVLAQTLSADEFVVVDDGSTDGGAGAAIVERMAKEHPIIKLLRKPNGGQSSARNFGVAHSRSALIALLDQDDYWYPHHLETLIKPFRDRRGIPLGWSYSNLDLTDERGRLVTRNYLQELPVEHPKRHLLRCLAEDMHVLPGASLISRTAFEFVGGFDERLSGYEDDDLFLRLFSAGYYNVFLDEPLSQWRMVANSSGHSARMFTSGMVYVRKLLREYPDDECCKIYYARDVIAPRFMHAALVRYKVALRDRNFAQQCEACDGMALLAQHLSWKKRTLFQLILPLMRWPFGGRTLLATMPVARRVYLAIFA